MMAKFFTQLVLVGIVGFAVGALFTQLLVSPRSAPPAAAQQRSDQGAFSTALHQAARIAEAKGINPREVGFGMNVRNLYFGDTRLAMVLPWPQTKVPAENVHESVVKTGRWANWETDAVVKIFSRHCGKQGPQLVLDVGSNVGYYSLIAAAHGCKVMAFDGNLEALTYLRMSAALNGFSHRITAVEALVSNVTDVSYDGWSAYRQEEGDGPRPGDSGQAAGTSAFTTTKVVRLDDVVREPVLYAKIDVEGWEASAFSSAVRLLTEAPPRYVFFELSYYMDKVWRYDYMEVTKILNRAGYVCESESLHRPIPLPETREEFDSLIKGYSGVCNTWKRQLCQDEVLCIHQTVAYNPVRSYGRN